MSNYTAIREMTHAVFAGEADILRLIVLVIHKIIQQFSMLYSFNVQGIIKAESCNLSINLNQGYIFYNNSKLDK